jgi:hypothetical protein
MQKPARETETAAANLREGGKPYVLECMTLRVRGHYEGDPQKYRDLKELGGLEADDPIARAAEVLRALPDGRPNFVRLKEVALRVAEAVRQAKDDPLPISSRRCRTYIPASGEQRSWRKPVSAGPSTRLSRNAWRRYLGHRHREDVSRQGPFKVTRVYSTSSGCNGVRHTVPAATSVPVSVRLGA